MKYISASFFLFLLSFVPAVSQDIKLPALSGFKIVTSYPVYTADNLWDFINGAADNYLSLGFENVHIAEYKKGKNVIKLEIYKHKDEIQTFGIYASERSPSFDFVKIGAQGYKTEGSLNFFKGDYYVKIRTYSKSEKVMKSLETLATKVSDVLSGSSDMPSLLKELPAEGKKANEETYIKESVLGHEYLTGALKAPYEIENSRFSIFLLKKNSNEEAAKTVTAYLRSAGLEPDNPAGGKFVFKDGYNGDIFLAWKENNIVIISGLAGDQTGIAAKYSAEILK
jgi:hypothetical protein